MPVLLYAPPTMVTLRVSGAVVSYSKEDELPSTFIGDSVSRHLREVDKIAYVRFASVYRQFDDVGELIQEAQEINDAPPVGPGQRDLFEDQPG